MEDTIPSPLKSFYPYQSQTDARKFLVDPAIDVSFLSPSAYFSSSKAFSPFGILLESSFVWISNIDCEHQAYIWLNSEEETFCENPILGQRYLGVATVPFGNKFFRALVVCLENYDVKAQNDESKVALILLGQEESYISLIHPLDWSNSIVMPNLQQYYKARKASQGGALTLQNHFGSNHAHFFDCIHALGSLYISPPEYLPAPSQIMLMADCDDEPRAWVAYLEPADSLKYSFYASSKRSDLIYNVQAKSFSRLRYTAVAEAVSNFRRCLVKPRVRSF